MDPPITALLVTSHPSTNVSNEPMPRHVIAFMIARECVVRLSLAII